VLQHAVGEIHRLAPFDAGGNEQPAGRVEVDAVRRGQAEVAAEAARRDAEGAPERARERRGRRVAGADRGFDDGRAVGGQLVRGPLEQEPAAKSRRRLAEPRRDQAVEMEAAQVRAPREVVPAAGVVQALDQDVDQGADPVACRGRRHGRMIATGGCPCLTVLAEV